MSIDNQHLTVVCGVRDRIEPLVKALPTWLGCHEIDEVVLVDYSSMIPVHTALSIRDRRITHVRVKGQKYWCASKSHNLGIRIAKPGLILRLDADYQLMPKPAFFDVHKWKRGSFYYFDQTRKRNENENHLAGVLLASRADILAVNGYNERIDTYGWEDDDLILRLKASGLAALPVDADTLFHIPHDDASRTLNHPIEVYSELVKKPSSSGWPWSISLVNRSIDMQRRLAEQNPWKKTDLMVTWLLNHTFFDPMTKSWIWTATEEGR